MFSTEHIKPTNPPKLTAYMVKRPLCGLCKYKCCTCNPGFECTPEEQVRLQLPQVRHNVGVCSELTPGGCKHGEGRPVHCKLFPAQVKDMGAGTPPLLVLSNWCNLNCPFEDHYELQSHDAAGYHYKRKEVGGARKNNCDEFITVPVPLNQRPNALALAKEALVEFYGEAAYAKWERAQAQPKGFGLLSD